MKPLIPYYGGKQRIARWIISHFPEHKAYIEPFCGGAAVFFAKNPVILNVLNDKNEMLVNLYRVAKTRPAALTRLINATPHARSEFQRACKIYRNEMQANSLTQAWAMYVVSRQSFANILGRLDNWAFERCERSTSTKTWRTSKSRLAETISRLDHAQIESIDALKCIERYDSPDALFYIDPPYVNTNQGHYAGYTQQDFDALLNLLTTIKGKFFLSHYANDPLRQFAADNGWLIHERETRMTAAKNREHVDCKRTELLITNHIPPTLFP